MEREETQVLMQASQRAAQDPETSSIRSAVIRARRWATGTAVAAGVILAVAACSNSTSAGSSASGNAASASSTASSSAVASSTPPALKSILFVNPLPNNPAWHEIGNCMADEAKNLHISFSQAGPTGGAVDASYMLSRIQQGIADNVGALVTFPLSANQFRPVIQQARAHGIYVATVEGANSAAGQNVDVGTSYQQFGQLAAATVAKKPGMQYVGFIALADAPPSSTFIQAFTDAAKSYPNIKIVTIQYDNGNVTNDVDIATNMMTAHPQLNMFVTNEGAATPGVIAAIKAQNKVGKVFLTTNSIYSGAAAGIQAGIVYSTLLQNMCQIGREPVDVLAKIAAGQHVPPVANTGIKFATKANLAQLTANGTYQ
jgi:ABC-type sugar transport system substrate-binding protein